MLGYVMTRLDETRKTQSKSPTDLLLTNLTHL